jgi:hypothetical protein
MAIRRRKKTTTFASLEALYSRWISASVSISAKRRKAGILLLTFAGHRDHWKDPATGTKLKFEELLARLKRHAKMVEQNHAEPARLGQSLLWKWIRAEHHHSSRHHPF